MNNLQSTSSIYAIYIVDNGKIVNKEFYLNNLPTSTKLFYENQIKNTLDTLASSLANTNKDNCVYPIDENQKKFKIYTYYSNTINKKIILITDKTDINNINITRIIYNKIKDINNDNINNLKQYLTDLQDIEKNDKINIINNDINEVKKIMIDNIDKVLERGNKIDNLKTQSDELIQQSKTFFTTSKKLNNGCCKT
jgi:hypothetical protein